MPKQVIPFSDFVIAAGADHEEFISRLHDFMQENGCTAEIKESASGHVVSYVHKPTKRTIANYVFRKKGLMLRMYADNVAAYLDELAHWPASMKAAVKKSGVCKRLLDPTACNSRCLGGYDFVLDGEPQQKCRYGCFMFFVDDETKPSLLKLVESEMKARQNS